MINDDEIPGENIELKIIFDKDNNSYWAYLGNHGGGYFTEVWANKYFPNIMLYNSSSWPHYSSNWDEWELIDINEFLPGKSLVF